MKTFLYDYMKRGSSKLKKCLFVSKPPASQSIGESSTQPVSILHFHFCEHHMHCCSNVLTVKNVIVMLSLINNFHYYLSYSSQQHVLLVHLLVWHIFLNVA